MPKAKSTPKAADAASLYPQWKRLGIQFTGAIATTTVDVEQLVLATAAAASADERLTVCAASWLAAYHNLVDGRRLSELARAANARTRAYLGALLTLANEAVGGAGDAPQYQSALFHCRPLRPASPFYEASNAMAVDREWMKLHALPLFRRWGLWYDEAKLQHKSIRSMEHVLKVPELRIRALVGPSIEASCVAFTRDQVTTARSLSKTLGVTYAATHAAVARLVGRGLLIRTAAGIRQELRLSPIVQTALLIS